MATSKIGQTDHYQTFVQTWAAHCGAHPSTFVGQLNVTIGAEISVALQAAGEDVVGYAQDAVNRSAPSWKALARLFDDLANHLTEHDCYHDGCLQQLAPDQTICPGKVALVERLTRARAVLGLADTARP